MTMNVMKSDSIMIEDMLKVSWFESENEKALGEIMHRAKAVQGKISKNSQLECPFGCNDEHMKRYLTLYNDVCQRNRNIMTVVNNQIVQKCVVESLAPDFFGEPLLVLRPNISNDDSLICLFVRNNYVPKQRFVE